MLGHVFALGRLFFDLLHFVFVIASVLLFYIDFSSFLMEKVPKMDENLVTGETFWLPFRDLFRASILGCILVALWLHFGRFWFHFKPFSFHFGPFWLHFGPYWPHFGPFWLHFGRFGSHSGSIFDHFGSQKG